MCRSLMLTMLARRPDIYSEILVVFPTIFALEESYIYYSGFGKRYHRIDDLHGFHLKKEYIA